MEQSSTSTSRKTLEFIQTLILNQHPNPSSITTVHSASDSLRRILSSGKRIAAEALALLISVPDTNVEKSNERLDLLRSVLSEDIVLSLASSSAFVVRSRLLDLLLVDANCDSEGLGISSMRVVLGVFLALTEDIYPSVRCKALEGVAVICKSGGGDETVELLTEKVYEKASFFLKDDDGTVRIASIHLLSEWGQMMVKKSAGGGLNITGISDAIFMQMCTMARDMDVKVRVEAFVALGKVKLVSEKILLQSLSKKVLVNHSRENTISEYTTRLLRELKCSLSSAAGAFVHGLEDEFHEVRTSASLSLGMLAVFSIQFAKGVINLLMDMLNDDSMGVKMQTLNTFLNMSQHDQLKVQEMHMHLFLGMFADISASIRHASRKVLCVMVLSDTKMFKFSIDSLLKNLEAYPQDEEHVLSVLFQVGRNHETFATHFLEECIHEVGPSCGGEMKMDGPRVVAILVLAISAHFSCEKNCNIPHKIFTYAITFYGRISYSLRNLVNQDHLLAYLCCHSGVPFSMVNFNSKQKGQLQISSEGCYSSSLQSCGTRCQIQESLHLKKENVESRHAFGSLVQFQPQMALIEDASRSIVLILKAVAGAWSLIKMHRQYEFTCTLRSCQEELQMIGDDGELAIAPALAFASLYIEVIHLLAEACCELLPGKFYAVGMHKSDIILNKLDSALMEMRYTFPGLSKQEEIHVLELSLLCCLARHFRTGIYLPFFLKMINANISRIEHLCGEETSNVSNFIKEIRNVCPRGGTNQSCISLPVRNLVELFSLEQLQFSGRFGHIKAELQVLGNDSENPIPFVSGLPVGVTFQITLYDDVSKDHRLWLQMIVGNSVQHAFLNLSQFEISDKLRYCTTQIPFYGAPNAAAFVMKALVVMECPHEYLVNMRRGKGGPKYETVALCKMKDVYFVNNKD